MRARLTCGVVCVVSLAPLSGCKPRDQVWAESIVKAEPWVLTTADVLECGAPERGNVNAVAAWLRLNVAVTPIQPHPIYEFAFQIDDDGAAVEVGLGNDIDDLGYAWDGTGYIVPSATRDEIIASSGLVSPDLTRLFLSFGEEQFGQVDWSDRLAAESARWIVERKQNIPELRDGASIASRNGLIVVVWRTPIHWQDGVEAVRMTVWDTSPVRVRSMLVTAPTHEKAIAHAERLACLIEPID